jgi:predicted permease
MNPRSDIRYAFYQLRKSPGFTITVLLTLGLCIGANTAIYSVVDSVLVRALPYPAADRLGSLARQLRSSKGESLEFGMDGAMWEAVHRGVTKIDVAAEGSVSGVYLAAAGRVKFVQQQRVSSSYFHVLGVPPLIGREFDNREDSVGGPQVAILSHQLWQSALQGITPVVGRNIELRGQPFTVVGVMPPNFANKDKADLWTPLRASTAGEGGGINYQIWARLKPGVTWNEAAAEVSVIEQPVLKVKLVQWGAPRDASASMRLVPLQRALTDKVRSSVIPKYGAVVLILLIGCVNIAGILLARSTSRRREIATRMALGANRARIISQLLTESLLLALGGGAIGLVVAACALDGLKRLGMEGFDLWRPIAIDGRVLLMTLVVSLITGVVFGLIPALESSRVDIRSILVEGGRGTQGRGQRRMRQMLVAGEIAMGMVLLASAGLLIKTLAHLQGLDPGFDPNHVLVAQLSLQDARYDNSAKINSLFQKSLDRIRALPGIESAAVGLSLPYQTPLNVGVKVLDGPDRSPDYGLVDMVFVTPGYHETLRIPLKGGRTFEDRDNATAQPVVVVNAAFVARYLRHQNALGTHVDLVDLGDHKPVEIVGLVADTPHRSNAGNFGPLSATPTMYVPSAQTGDKGLAMIYTWFSPNWIVRTTRTDHRLQLEMQSALQAIDPKIPFSTFETMAELQGSSVARQRYEAILFTAFAALALLLAAVGVYGLVAASVSQRTKEIGIRMALGASSRQAISVILVPGLKLAAIGTAVGLLLTWFATAFIRKLVWGVKPHDFETYLLVTLLMFVVVAIANLLPTRKLLKLDPAHTLRDQ